MRISDMLIERGIDLPRDIISMDELCEKLAEIKAKKGGNEHV